LSDHALSGTHDFFFLHTRTYRQEIGIFFQVWVLAWRPFCIDFFSNFAHHMSMKALAVFLSLYVIVLSCIPCPDMADQYNLHRTEIAQSPSHGDHGDADHCSPFCTCQCCQACFHVAPQPPVLTAPGSDFVYCEISPVVKSPDLFDFLVPPKA